MALVRAERLRFSYPDAPRPALDGVSVELEAGEIVAVLGPSGSGKSTLLRAFSGLVPHFHGGRFEGRVEVAGLDTRTARPSDLAGHVGTLFQDPEDQVVLSRVDREVQFGLENLGVPPGEIAARTRGALAAVGAEHLMSRLVSTLSGGELQRVCLASTLALRPALLLLDEPTSQLDPDAAAALLELVSGLGCAVVVSEQRPARPLAVADRVLFLERGRILLDAPRDAAVDWLARERPEYLGAGEPPPRVATGDVVCALRGVRFGYGADPVVEDASFELRRGEVVALLGPNGSGKTTIAKIAAGVLEPQAGAVERTGTAAMMLQDPGRYLVAERAREEVALGAHGDLERASRALARVGLAGFESRHPQDLSSGERERVALASVLVMEPDLLVLDEPTRGVDPARKVELAAQLRSEARGRATLVVSHDETFAAAVADRAIVLGGRVREPILA
jgi:energy-coupling factor transport system ATP-binding protein